MSDKVLITGATGVTGGGAIEKLLDMKVPVRALVHSLDERSESLRDRGVEIVLGDLSDFDSVSDALRGITAAYFVYTIQVGGLLESTAYFAQAALEQRVSHIVNMSQISARRDAKSHAAQNHWLAERLLDRTGIGITHLRPTFFSEWLMYFAAEIKGNDRLVLPFGDAKYAPIAGEDIGRVIASILLNPQDHKGMTYPLYGSIQVNQYETAEILSELLGRKITYIPAEIDHFSKMMEGSFTPYFIQHIANVAQDSRDGIFSGTNDHVEKISGRKPLHISDYIKNNIELFSF